VKLSPQRFTMEIVASVFGNLDALVVAVILILVSGPLAGLRSDRLLQHCISVPTWKMTFFSTETSLLERCEVRGVPCGKGEFRKTRNLWGR
jgi:hypothetical protein